MEKIYLVSINVTSSSCVFKKTAYSFKKTEKGYVVEKESNFGGKVTRVPAGEILKVDSMLISNTYTAIQFYTWCFKDQLKYAQFLLIFEADKKIADIKEKIGAISKQFTKASSVKLK
jgi:hypothetical protein